MNNNHTSLTKHVRTHHSIVRIELAPRIGKCGKKCTRNPVLGPCFDAFLKLQIWTSKLFMQNLNPQIWLLRPVNFRFLTGILEETQKPQPQPGPEAVQTLAVQEAVRRAASLAGPGKPQRGRLEEHVRCVFVFNGKTNYFTSSDPQG